MINVICWLWKGWRPVYKVEHVLALQRMLDAHLHMPHRLICVTDEDVPGVECVPNWATPVRNKRGGQLPDCYRRLKLFADESFGPECLSIDLDCVILNDITELVEQARTHPFKILAGKHAPYNGSMWYVKPGVNAHVWTGLTQKLVDEAKAHRFSERGMRKPIGSDQAVMSYLLQGAPTWDESDGVYQSVSTPRHAMQNPRIVFFAGRLKPWEHREFKDEYQKYRG